MLRFFPDALPVVPAAIAPAIWLALFPRDRPVDPRTQRVLVIFGLAGVATFVLGIGVFVAAG